jgi:predicted nucleotidyltransferase
MNNDLSKNILATLVYYDVLDYPLTAFEIWKYLFRSNREEENSKREKGNALDVLNCLEQDNLKKFIEEYRGFYFLKGRKKLAERRIENNKISEEKLKIIQKVVCFLRFVPFVRMIAVTGRVAMKNARKESDLDLLIVLKYGHIFTGRLLVTLLVHILGKRRYGNKIKNRICLNYFITTESLEISNQDLFSSSEYFFMRPIFGFKVFRKFQIKNSWIGNYHPNFSIPELADNCLIKDNYFSKKIRKTGELIFGNEFVENILKRWQLKRINKDPRTYQAGSMVKADEKELIFLPEPKGPDIFEKFQKKLEELRA